jgi:hypothetical protein
MAGSRISANGRSYPYKKAPAKPGPSISKIRSSSRHCEEQSDEAIHSSSMLLDCFAEPVIGRRFAPTRWHSNDDVENQRE